MTDTKTSRRAWDIDADIAHALRVRAAELDSTQQELVIQILRAALASTIKRLANPGLAAALSGHAQAVTPRAPKTSRRDAMARARALKRTKSYAEVADALNGEGFKTATGKRWSAGNVQQRLRGSGQR